MGMNFQSACHKHKVKKFHFRRKENETLMPFYQEHYDCMVENRSNLETKEDQIQEDRWMSEYKSDNQ